MKYTKKFRVIPYSSDSLQKPSENYIENIDNKMKSIISNKSLPDDYKIKLYHQNLNKFLLKYDPDSYGVAPSIVKLIKVVGDYLEKKNEIQIIDKDLENVIKPKTVNFKIETKSEDIDDNFNSNENDEKDTKNEKLFFNEKFYNLNPNDYYLNQSDINSSDLNGSYFESETKPSQNTRSKNSATHSEGIQYNQAQKTKEKNKGVQGQNFETKPNNTSFFISSNPKTLRSPQGPSNTEASVKSPFLTSKDPINNKYKNINNNNQSKISKSVTNEANKSKSSTGSLKNKQSASGLRNFVWSSWKN